MEEEEAEEEEEEEDAGFSASLIGRTPTVMSGMPSDPSMMRGGGGGAEEAASSSTGAANPEKGIGFRSLVAVS